MDHQAVSFDMTLGEARYLFFKKKKCPKCGGKLDRQKSFQTKCGEDYSDKRGYIPPPTGKVKQYQYYFICQECGARYSLQELAK